MIRISCRSANRLTCLMFTYALRREKKDKLVSYLPRPCSGPAAAAGGGAAAAHRRRPVPGPQGPTGPADPPSPPEQPNPDPIPDQFPRQARADQTYRSLITERQLGSRSDGRARLIRATNRVFVEKMTEGKNPPPGVELFKMDASKKVQKEEKQQEKKGASPPRVSSTCTPPSSLHPDTPPVLSPTFSYDRRAGRGYLRGRERSSERRPGDRRGVGGTAGVGIPKHTHRAGKS